MDQKGETSNNLSTERKGQEDGKSRIDNDKNDHKRVTSTNIEAETSVDAQMILHNLTPLKNANDIENMNVPSLFKRAFFDLSTPKK